MAHAASESLRICCLAIARFGLLRYSLAYVRGLASCEDVSVLLIVPEEEREYVSAALAGLPHHARQRISVCYVKVLGNLNRLRLPARILGLIWKSKPHVVHDPVGIAFTFGIAVWPLVKTFVPLVVTFHDPKPHSGMGRTLWSRVRRSLIRFVPHKVVVHGAANARDAERYGVRPDKLIISEHGLLDQFDDSIAAQEEPAAVLFFGQLRPNKGMEMLVRIADEMHMRLPEFRLIVAGMPPAGAEFRRSGWTNQVQRILQEMRCRQFVEVHDRFISDEEAGALFSRASVILLPYRDASQSGVLLLAIGFRKIVVATDVGELGRTLSLYGGGIIADYDASSLTDALFAALTSKREGLRRKIDENAQVVEASYGFAGIASRLVAEYRLLARRPDRKTSQDAIDA